MPEKCNPCFYKRLGEHERESFDCGKVFLNNFLKQLATQYRKKNLGQTYVIVTPNRRVIGYYTISISRVDYDNVSDDLRRKFH